MATVDQLVEVREYIAELTEDGGWTDERISTFISREPNLFAAASAIWSAKASAYAGLVNVSESGSSRNLGQLIDNALKMAALYKARSDAKIAAEMPTAIGGPIISKLVRP